VIIIRWLGAFGKKGTLQESLNFELSGKSDKLEIAAEPLVNYTSNIDHVKVGLLVKNSYMVKYFNGDCWSVYNEENKLYKKRNPKQSNLHRECWIKYSNANCFKGIVYKKGITCKALKTLRFTSNRVKLPLYELSKGTGLMLDRKGYIEK
jgi:hypothetical protein